MEKDEIILRDICVNNLKNVSLSLKKNHLITITGVSGSGKSSLAFDTLFHEGQRRFVSAFSASAKRFFPALADPKASFVEGITPTLALDQKTRTLSARSTVGTMTHIYDFLRLLFTHVATAYCPISHTPVTPQSIDSMIRQLFNLEEGASLIFLSPIERSAAEKKDFADNLVKMGFLKIATNHTIKRLDEPLRLPKNADIDLVIDKVKLLPENKHRIIEALTSALNMAQGVAKVWIEGEDQDLFFSESAFSKEANKSYPPLKAHDFSFNHPQGMCSECEGLGWVHDFDLDAIIDPNLSISEGACALAPRYSSIKWCNIYDNLASIYDFSLNDPWNSLSSEAKEVFLYGTKEKWTRMRFYHKEKKQSWTEYVSWKGVLHEAKKRYSNAKSDVYKNNMHQYMSRQVCPSCKGSRLKPYPSHAKLEGKTIAEITSMSIGEALPFFLELTDKQAGNELALPLLEEINKRLEFLSDLGLNYLSLDRSAPTLSGGESQRVRLAFQVGGGLTQSTYILDEPSIGLHPRDQKKLLASLQMLRDRNNTVICVEHDEATMLASDWLIDMGPGAGSLGGKVVFDGPLSELEHAKNSLTADYITGRKSIPVPKRRKPANLQPLVLENARLNNLKEVTLTIPLGLFVAIAGVSGSGKSSLITSTLYPALNRALEKKESSSPLYDALSFDPALEKVLLIDQNPIGRTPRSNPSTYIKLFDEIRDLFAKLPRAKAKGFGKGRFSFNVQEGNCTVCSGMGSIKVENESTGSISWITCEACAGDRFDEATLSIEYKGENIADILAMTICEATEFFSEIPNIYKKLSLLKEMGLGYLQVGQSSTTLSGGEAQRIKLTKELLRPPKKHTLYILDEPTTGLHFDDISRLITILQNMVDLGHTVVVIEHHTDLLKIADHIIELGPDGGADGGRIVANGTPEQVSKQKTETAPFIKAALAAKKPKIAPYSRKSTNKQGVIEVMGANQNTLKGVSATIDHRTLTVCTGPSGAGKSSFAIDTLYSEGLRRFTDSLAPYQRQFVTIPEPAEVDSITGLSPAIAIEQKKHAGSPRSTVGTLTEIYDQLRELFTHLGIAKCPDTGEELGQITVDFLVGKLMSEYEGQPLYVLSPFKLMKQETLNEAKERMASLGFTRYRMGKRYAHIDEDEESHEIEGDLFLVIDRLFAKKSMNKRLAEAVETCQNLQKGPFVIQIGDQDHTINLDFASLKTGKSYPKPHPRLFSFNRDEGKCPECMGLGFQMGAYLQEDSKLSSISVYDLFEFLFEDHFSKQVEKCLLPFLDHMEIDPDDIISELTLKQRKWLFEGSSKTLTYQGIKLSWMGINKAVEKSLQRNNPNFKSYFLPYTARRVCEACGGGRLSPYARSVFVKELSIDKVSSMPLKELASWVEKIKLDKKLKSLLEYPLSQIKEKLALIKTMGLDYLTLLRGADTLSSGEAQRIYITRQMGSLLTGILYVLEEPSRGLHPHNRENLIKILQNLTAMGNTLVVIDQSLSFIKAADKVLEFGPYGGPSGGFLLAQGTPKELIKNKNSLTAPFLADKTLITAPQRKKGISSIIIKELTLNNLHNLSIELPKGVLCGICGVSGAGKSTLVMQALLPAAKKQIQTKNQDETLCHLGARFKGLNEFKQVVSIDQTPLTTSTRGDVCSFLDLKTHLRQFYASLKEAKLRGLTPGHFSANTRKGMCKACWGMGHKKAQFQFMATKKVVCESCNGFGLQALPLKVEYKGKHLGHLLEMTLEDAAAFLPPMPKLLNMQQTLASLKLGYLRLNQDLSTLSLGEVSRLRLARELVKKRRAKTLFLMDEPSAGLHSSDLPAMIEALVTIREKGHSVILIDHHSELLNCMDHLIDLGPGSGPDGGKIVASGPPAMLKKVKNSLTGSFL